MYIPREPFLLLESWDWPNLGHCGVCPQEDGDLPATGDGHQLHQGWKGSTRFAFHQTSLWPPQFPSPPRAPFTFGNESASRTSEKHGQDKKRTPILGETKQQWAQPVVCGLLGRTQIAFLPWLCAAIEGLQHLRPWHRHPGQDLELFQEAQETYTSGQELGIHRAVLDDLR